MILCCLFMILAVICGILSALSIVSMQVFWICLGIFWLMGVIGAITESVSGILMYRCWLYEADSVEEKGECRSWIKEEVRMMLIFPWFASLMVVLYSGMGLVYCILGSLTEWLEDLRVKKTLAH